MNYVNDPFGYATAQRVAIGASIGGTLDDWYQPEGFRVRLEANTTYLFSIAGAAANGGTLVATSDRTTLARLQLLSHPGPDVPRHRR
jgi:hypothetical protein